MIWTPNCWPGQQQVAGRRVRVPADGLTVQEVAVADGQVLGVEREGVDELHVGGRRRPVVGDDDGEAHGATGGHAERILLRGGDRRCRDEVPVGVHLDDELLHA